MTRKKNPRNSELAQEHTTEINIAGRELQLRNPRERI